MLNKIKENIEKYVTHLDGLKENAKEVKKKLSENKYIGFLEKEQLQTIKEVKDVKVAGCDSGFFCDSLTGIDFVFIKPAGCFFEYKNGKLIKSEKIIEDQKLLFSNDVLQKDEVAKFVSIERIIEEVQIATKLLEFNPDYVILDGPVLPQPVDRPLNTSKLYPRYKEMLEAFVELYNEAKKINCVVVGSVEDSRATSFLDMIDLPKKRINDTNYLNFVLEQNQALGFFPIFKEASNVINQDLEPFGNFRFNACYFKINDDYPLRIEIVNFDFNDEKLKEIKGVLGFLSNVSKTYAYPSVIVNADKYAKTTNSERELIQNLINQEFMQKNIFKLRRERRI
jgi:hypothetical protein